MSPGARPETRSKRCCPRLGDLKGVEIELISKSRTEYQGERYRLSGLPPAPAVMLDDEVVAQGRPIAEEQLRELIAARQKV